MRFNLDKFISEYVTKRPESMILEDIKNHANELKDAINGSSVLVIGGAGSIGTAFIKELLKYHPMELYVIDINENALTELIRDIRSSGMYIPKNFMAYPISYASKELSRIFQKHGRFDYVANFAAHKHVRSEKDVFSIEALLNNNIIYAKDLLELIAKFPPLSYFCVSTDKAANPVNIMGASKRIMEDLICSYSDAFSVHTARFANVAFSNGSLLDSFIARLDRLQPISAPMDIKRYFVSPEESGQICLISAILGNNKEIFFPKLDIAAMTTFDQIAVDFLSINGYKPVLCSSDKEAIEKAKMLKSDKNNNDYPVRFTKSDTSGEKFFEEFYTDKEILDMQRYSSLGVIVEKEIADRKKIEKLIERFEKAFDKECSKEELIQMMSEYLPEFVHSEMGKNLDERM